MKLVPLWRASGVQDIADKDVKTEERGCDEKDDEGRKQQERPGRRYDSDKSGDGDGDEGDGDGESEVRARWLHRLSGLTRSGDYPGQSRSNPELPMATTNGTKPPRPLSTLESFLIGGVAASCAVGAHRVEVEER